MPQDLTAQTVELLQTLIRNRCVNDGRPESGQEIRNAEVLEQVLAGSGLDYQTYEPTPGRVSLVSRIEGTDPTAPSLCLMGHTDVVPVNEAGWTRDPFGGELVDGEVWGRGAVDMLDLTSSMAVVFRHLADTDFRPRGDLIFFAVADEESGSAHGARWMADNHADDIMADYVLTDNGGLHGGSDEGPTIGVTVAEKGVAWRRLTVKGTPGHGSMPYRKDNALIKAAAVVQRLADYRPPPRFGELWRTRVEQLPVDSDTKRLLLDESRIDSLLDAMPSAPTASFLHACTHTTFSANVADGGGEMKTNVIPDTVHLEVDVRTLGGEGPDEVTAHLNAALGDLAAEVEVSPLMNDRATVSGIDNPLWDAMGRAAARPFPGASLTPSMSVGFTDARIYREMGAIAYGAGLLSPDLEQGDFASRFHGHDERIDVESHHQLLL